MLNNAETVKELSFTNELRQLSLEQLRDKESFLIDEILQHYDELQNRVGVMDCNYYIERDNFKLQAIRNEIEYQQKTTMINSCDGIFQALFHDEPKEITISKHCNQKAHKQCVDFGCDCACHDVAT